MARCTSTACTSYICPSTRLTGTSGRCGSRGGIRPCSTPSPTAASDPELAPGRVASPVLDGIPRPTGPLPIQIEPGLPRVAPTSAGRFALQVTLDQRTHDLLRRAQELLGRGSPGSEISRVLERALEDLVQKLEHGRFAATESPRACRSSGNGRYIPAEMRRLVAERDRYRCAFVSDTGKRCTERSDPEYDHIQPFARGGRTTVDNLRLLCPAHNHYEAERVYGEGFMRAKREALGRRLTCVRERAPGYSSACECAALASQMHESPHLSARASAVLTGRCGKRARPACAAARCRG